MQARGELDEALQIRNEEELPVYERLGDVRERAVTMGQIADILQARGEFDEALRIRSEEELPVYRAARRRARARGDDGPDRRHLAGPRRARRGAAHSAGGGADLRTARCGARPPRRARTEQAITRLLRDRNDDRDEARQLLRLALEEARRLELPEAQQIEQIINQAGLGSSSLEVDP